MAGGDDTIGGRGEGAGGGPGARDPRAFIVALCRNPYCIFGYFEKLMKACALPSVEILHYYCCNYCSYCNKH